MGRKKAHESQKNENSLDFFLRIVRFVAAAMVLVQAGPGHAAEKKHAPAAAAVKAPEIRRTAVYRDQGGEPVLRSPIALVRDPHNGDLLITSFEAGEVVILDKSGVLLKRMGREEGLVSPYGVALDGKGRIYVSELKTGLVKVFSPGGAPEDEIDLSRAAGRTVAPGRITVDKNGFLYAVDLNNNGLVVLDEKGMLVRSLTQFNYPQKAGAAGDGRIVSTSAYGKAVKVFSGDGELLGAFGDHGDVSDRNVSYPAGFAVDARGRLWFADAFQHRLKVFSLDGKFLFNYGKLEEKTGGFFFPVDLCFGDAGELFVVEKGANRVQVFQVGDLKK